jgi:hypothetical protein
VEPSQDVFEELRMTPIELVIGSVNNDFVPTRFALDGFGQTMMESVRNALSQWTTGAAPLLLAAFGPSGGYTPEIIEEDTTIPGANGAPNACWRMYLGQHTTGVIGLKGGSSFLSAHIQQHHLLSLLGPSLKVLQNIGEQVNYCWLNMYLSRDQGGSVNTECTLNDSALAGGAEALQNFAWPDFDPTFAFVRQYGILKRIPC